MFTFLCKVFLFTLFSSERRLNKWSTHHKKLAVFSGSTRNTEFVFGASITSRLASKGFVSYKKRNKQCAGTVHAKVDAIEQ